MRSEIKKFVLLAAMLALIVSCAKSANETKSAGDSTVLATVGNKTITTAMYEDELNNLPPQVRQYFLRQGGSQAFLNEIINKELLYQEAMKEGIDKDKGLKQAVESYKKITMVKMLLQRKIEGASTTVSDADVKNYYDTHKEDFKLKGPGKTEKVLPFPAIKALIRQHLIEAKQEQAFAEYVNNLKKTAKININERAVQTLQPAPEMENTPVAK
ncbi:MAG: SurA N-terminal domain-containing protein [Nitrospiraceae bacterium]|nr:SurA N-terminal domain-containing protein [Nitrospiraceae bacterium]